MKELAMHVYDLMENSTAANSTEVRLTIKDSLKDNIYAFTIEDNGKGMTVKVKSVNGAISMYPEVMVEINVESDYQKPKFQSYATYSHDCEYDDYNDYDWSAGPDYHEVEVDDDIRDAQMRREDGDWDY